MWYSEISDLYDALVQFDEDIPFFVEQCASVKGQVLELMAGTGRVSIPLLQAGANLTCVDNCPQMLERLRAKLARLGLSANVIQADVRHLALSDRFALAIAPFNSLSELVEEQDRSAALRNIHSCLVEGGRFICTLHNPSVRLARINSGTEEKHFEHPSGKGQVTFRISCEFNPASRVVYGTETFEIRGAAGNVTERRQVDIRFCLPEEAWLRQAARQEGFTVESLFGDYRRSEYREASSPSMIWVLRKQGRG